MILSRETYRKQMADSDWEPNGKWCAAFEVITPRVAGRKHCEDQHEGDAKLHSEGVLRAQQRVWHGAP